MYKFWRILVNFGKFWRLRSKSKFVYFCCRPFSKFRTLLDRCKTDLRGVIFYREPQRNYRTNTEIQLLAGVPSCLKNSPKLVHFLCYSFGITHVTRFSGLCPHSSLKIIPREQTSRKSSRKQRYSTAASISCWLLMAWCVRMQCVPWCVRGVACGSQRARRCILNLVCLMSCTSVFHFTDTKTSQIHN